MTKIYACLAGNWVCLNDDPECTISDEHKSPFCWWEENAPIVRPIRPDDDLDASFYHLDYVHIVYKRKRYRISPMFVQIVDQ